SSPKLRKQFLDLPWSLYENDPYWVPPLRMSQQQLLGYRPHPFYDDAASQTFVALRNGTPCGRIAAIVNHAHNRWHKEQRGFFGFFESVDDDEVSRSLFDAAAEWLRGKGMTAIRGPANP